MDLPDEILVRIVQSVGALSDMAALSMACRKMAEIWRDDSTWRELFARDYGHLYASGLVAMGWHPDAHVHALWPDDAKRFWREMMETYEPSVYIDGMPFGPDTPYDPLLPSPFAHMTALGKDWKWLYASHRPLAAGSPSSRSAATISIVDPQHLPHGTVSALYRGDVSRSGSPHGYGACFCADASGSTTHFSQSMWRDGQPDGWQTIVMSGCASSAVVNGRVGRVAYGVARSGIRVWGKRKRTSIHGMALVYRPDGSRVRAVLKEGKFRCGTTYHGDGASKGTWVGPTSFKEDQLERLPNGDVVLYECKAGAPVGVRWFQCSSRSPHSAYAGRFIRDVSWRLVESHRTCDRTHWAYIPAHSCDTDDARAFWQYVNMEEHGIGWNDRVRRAALDARATHPDGLGGPGRSLQ